MSGSSDEPRTVKLLCPAVSKAVAFIAWDEQKLDLGSIARAFGLDPWTLKLNGHFISRGIDFISSSVTWRSLLNFFKAKGLSTGKDDQDALLVDGKLCKSGTKRNDPEDDDANLSGVHYRNDYEEERVSGLKSKKLKKNHKSGIFGRCLWLDEHQHGFKRKQILEDLSLFKKLKITEASSDVGERGFGNDVVPYRKLKCSYIINYMKRRREEPVILAKEQNDSQDRYYKREQCKILRYRIHILFSDNDSILETCMFVR